jgi:hypothetical protein
MKLLLSILVSTLLLTACNTTTTNQNSYQSEQTIMQFKGQNIVAVQKQWGSPDQVMHTRNGTSFYVYSTSSGQGFFGSTSNAAYTTTNARDPMRAPYTGTMEMECTTLFKTDSTGMIIDTWRKGNNCGGKWVSKQS